MTHVNLGLMKPTLLLDKDVTKSAEDLGGLLASSPIELLISKDSSSSIEYDSHTSNPEGILIQNNVSPFERQVEANFAF